MGYLKTLILLGSGRCETVHTQVLNDLAIVGRRVKLRLKRSPQLTNVPRALSGVLSVDGQGYTISPRVAAPVASNRNSQ